MDIDVCYRTSEKSIFRHIKKYVDYNEISLAVCSLGGDLYINKKNIWNTLDVLKNDGVLAIISPLYKIDNTISAVRSVLNSVDKFDIVIFHNEFYNGRIGPCFYEACIAIVLVYKNQPPLLWKLPNPSNIHGMNPNIIACNDGLGNIEDRMAPHSSHGVISKLLEITNSGDVVLLIGDEVLHYTRSIKNMHRYVIGIGDKSVAVAANEGLRMVDLGD